MFFFKSMLLAKRFKQKIWHRWMRRNAEKMLCIFRRLSEEWISPSYYHSKRSSRRTKIEPVFKSIKRIRCAKRQFDEIAQDEPIVCPKKKLGYRPMYPECVTFLRKTMRVREIVTGNIMHLSHSHGFAQKRNAFRIHETAPLEIEFFNPLLDTALVSLKERFE